MAKNTPPTSRNNSRPKKSFPWRWVGFAVAPLSLAILVGVSTVSEREDVPVAEAVPFELMGTDGQTATLDESLAEGDALLYFSMGVGCDGCFAQIPELESAVAERGMSLVPIMVDPAIVVANEAARWGIDLPILIDSDSAVSEAYGMVGQYGHGGRPSHSFALVRQSGEIAWVRHYAEMFVPADALFEELDSALES